MKLFITIATILMLLGMTGIASAHPPSDIAVTYDPATKMVMAVITHQVSNAETHYIKKVDVGVNGKEVIEQLISRQDNNSTQTVSYLVPDAKPGDAVSVEAYCSISGKLTKEIKVTP